LANFAHGLQHSRRIERSDVSNRGIGMHYEYWVLYGILPRTWQLLVMVRYRVLRTTNGWSLWGECKPRTNNAPRYLFRVRVSRAVTN